MNLRLTRRLTSAVTIAALAFAGLAAAPAALAAPVVPDYSLDSTVDAGDITRSEVFDGSANRLYFTIDRGTAAPGAVGWIDGTTGAVAAQTFELDDTEPSVLAVNESKHELYVLHYRNGKLTVIDTTTGTVARVIEGLPELAGLLDVNTDTGELYVTDAGVTTVNPATGAVSAEVSITTERFPLIKDTVYDSKNRMLWIAEGRAGVITGYSSVTQGWMSSIAVPITKFQQNGADFGGRAAALAIDESLGHLYVAVSPRLADDWVNTQLVTLDTDSLVHLGSPIELGETTRELAVNPVTHEIYASNGFSNTFSVVSPASWSVSSTIDFTAEGVTEGTGTVEANVWALAVDSAGEKAYVSHPYGTARISTIVRTGPVETPTPLAATPGQDVPEPEDPANTPWTGPASKPLAAIPAGAAATTDNTISWSVSDYAKEWERDLFGAVTTNADKEFIFSGGTGWSNPATGAAQISWESGFRLRPYPGLAPDVALTYGNPYLTVAADGSGELSFDVAWSVTADLKSTGYERVVVATFPAGSGTTVNGVVTQTWNPEFIGRAYTPAGGPTYPDSYPAQYVNYLDPAVRAWWYSSGSTLDPIKVPNPVTVSYTAGAVTAPDPEPSPDPTPDPVDPTISLSLGSVVAGGTITVEADGLRAREATSIWLLSTPVKLRSITADARGGFAAEVTIPEGTTPGVHHIELRTAASGTVSARLVVLAAPSDGDLASTGAQALLPLGASAAALLLLGGVLLVLRRRRHATKV